MVDKNIVQQTCLNGLLCAFFFFELSGTINNCSRLFRIFRPIV